MLYIGVYTGGDMRGKEIIEKELYKLTNSPNPEIYAPAIMNYYESLAYVQGLINAYQHALEMWE